MTPDTGELVHWYGGQGIGCGRVMERHPGRMARRIDGVAFICNGTADNPAVLIARDDGRQVLKLESELRPG